MGTRLARRGPSTSTEAPPPSPSRRTAIEVRCFDEPARSNRQVEASGPGDKSHGRDVAIPVRSVAQNDTARGSDLDLFIDYEPNSRFNAFDLVGIKQLLESELGVDVDITTRDGLHPMLRNDIEQSALQVF
jgi:uncharacterized protein